MSADLYPSNFEDWIEPRSVTNVLYVVHAEIGEAQKGSDTYKELLQIGVYFYSAKFIPSRDPGGYGTLEEIPLPLLDTPEWPLPDMCTTESFRTEFRRDLSLSNETHCWFESYTYSVVSSGPCHG